jgi:amino acid transporter
VYGVTSRLRGFYAADDSAVVVFHTRFSYWFSNGIGIVKVLTLVFISIAGLVVLGGNVPRVPNPRANFIDAFEGRATPYGLTNALYKIVFSYAGYENAFNVVNEVKVLRFPLPPLPSSLASNTVRIPSSSFGATVSSPSPL